MSLEDNTINWNLLFFVVKKRIFYKNYVPLLLLKLSSEWKCIQSSNVSENLLM